MAEKDGQVREVWGAPGQEAFGARAGSSPAHSRQGERLCAKTGGEGARGGAAELDMRAGAPVRGA